jgi:response regulator NasT
MTDSKSVTKTSPPAARILIADDDPGDRHSLRDALNQLGYDVVAEASGSRQAVDLAGRLQPDLVIIDADMDEAGGVEAAAAIIGSDIAPVILIAEAANNIGQLARDVSISGFLVKPPREEELPAIIEVALARHGDVRWLRERVAELEDALETRKVVERAKGILMDLHGLSEADAFRRMRKTSMDNRKTMREVAEAILLSHDLQLGSDII